MKRNKGFEKVCAVCGKPFIARDDRQKYCGENCYHRARSIMAAEKNRERREAERLKNHTAVCPICGKTFERINSEKYCSYYCRKVAQARQKTEYSERTRGIPIGFDNKTESVCTREDCFAYNTRLANHCDALVDTSGCENCSFYKLKVTRRKTSGHKN